MVLESNRAFTSTICTVHPRMCCLTAQLLSRNKYFLNLNKLISIPRFYFLYYSVMQQTSALNSCLLGLTFPILIVNQFAGHELSFQQPQFIILNNTEAVRSVFPSIRNLGRCQTCQMTFTTGTGGVAGVFEWLLPEQSWPCKLVQVSWLLRPALA